MTKTGKTKSKIKKHVFVAMSGGVDSSVAALLIKQSGEYELTGAFIKGWYPPGVICSWREDRRDAMRVCAKLGMPFITIDAEKEYKKEVVDYMISEYKAGRTPNPDIMCNQKIKFGIFLKKALAMGADYIATGHYTRLQREITNNKIQITNKSQSSKTKFQNNSGFASCLASARDSAKDQSYFLWTLTQDQLKHAIFPLGNLLKSEVRKIAEENNLPTASKDESQGVCFIGEFNMEKFLEKHIKPKKGDVVNTKGEMVGEHNGAMFYTIGQRHGFGYKGGGKGPYYIVSKDIKKNVLVVAEENEEKNFEKKEAEIGRVNWIGGKEPDLSKTYLARARYRQPLQECRIEINGGRCLVIFDKPQRAITPGQSLVIYDGEEMLGGGVIL